MAAIEIVINDMRNKHSISGVSENNQPGNVVCAGQHQHQWRESWAKHVALYGSGVAALTKHQQTYNISISRSMKSGSSGGGGVA